MNGRQMVTCAAVGFALLCVGITRAGADAIISVGSYTPTSPTFVVPIQIMGAVDLVTWQFDLTFDPADVQVNTGCDPATDSFCDVITGPVTEGPFTAGPFSLFVPGVIDNVNGLVSLIAGGYGGLPPGPSGDGILAYVEFTLLGDGESPITVESPSTTSSTVREPATSALLASGLTLLGAGALARHRRSVEF